MEAVPMNVPSIASGAFYVLLILTAVVMAVYYHLTTMKAVRLGKLIPGPPTLPVVGNAFELFGVPPNQLVKKLQEYEKYGSVIRAFLGRNLIVFLIDPKDIEVILGSHVHIDKASEYQYFAPWLGQGLLISTGDKWRSHRKIIAPTFHMNILKSFVPLFYENSTSLVDRLRDEIGKEFDCHDYLSAVTVDILLETAMGIRNKNKEKTGFEYAMAVMKMCDIIHQRQYNWHLRIDALYKFTNFAKQQKKLLGIIHGLTNRVIKERKAEYDEKSIAEARISSISGDEQVSKREVERDDSKRNEENKKDEFSNEERPVETRYVRDDLDDIDDNDVGEKKRLAFLDLMLEAARNGVDLTDSEIKEEVDTIMFEGHDTTAAGSSFVLCLLAIHRDIQTKVFQELRDIFKDSQRACTFHDTLEMKYLERVILETLRMYPPVPAVGRKISEDVKIVTNDYVIPAGTTIVVPTYQVHRTEEYYPNAEKFDPDNFLPERTQNRHYYAYIPFSAGPRSCVGRKYAMLKLKVLLSTILRNYKVISDLQESDFQLQADIILKRSDGFKIRIEPRFDAKD